MTKEPENYAEVFTNFNGEANCIVELAKKVINNWPHSSDGSNSTFCAVGSIPIQEKHILSHEHRCPDS